MTLTIETDGIALGRAIVIVRCKTGEVLVSNHMRSSDTNEWVSRFTEDENDNITGVQDE